MKREELLEIAQEIISDQELARQYTAEQRRAAFEAAFADGLIHILAEDSLADWLSSPEDAFPITDGVDVWATRDHLVQAWHAFLDSGFASEPWFQPHSWVQAVQDEADAA